MANLTLLLPDAKDIWRRCQWGADRLFTRERHGALADSIAVCDFASSTCGFSAELVLTQPVAMRIHGPCYRRFLDNLCEASERWLLLVENLRRHNFARTFAATEGPSSWMSMLFSS